MSDTNKDEQMAIDHENIRNLQRALSKLLSLLLDRGALTEEEHGQILVLMHPFPKRPEEPR